MKTQKQYNLFLDSNLSNKAKNLETSNDYEQRKKVDSSSLNELKNLKDLSNIVSSCHKCKLASTRSNVVFGEGNPSSEVMFIGEGPGRKEDLEARPFIGPSGQLLTRMIEKGMGVSRDEVYICNLVKCRPTVDLAFIKDRAPNPEELEACTPYLLKQIQIVSPKVIISVGNPATKFLLKTKLGITALHGKWHEFESIPVMPIYHPSYILRNGGETSPLKHELWEDIKLVMKKLNWPLK